MTAVNAILGRVADAVLGPLHGLTPLAVMLVLALATALVILAVMKKTSDQDALAAAKRRIHADLLEMRLFNDDVRALVRAQGALLAHNGRYLWLSFVPVLVTALPLTLAIAQVQSWYGYSGLAAGEPTLVTADLQGEAGATTLPTLDAPGADIDGAPMYFPTLHQVVWRIVPREPGPHTLQVRLASGVALDKTLHTGTDVARRSPSRERADLLTQLLYPSEAPLPADAPVTAIRVEYPERALDVFGYELHWLIVYLAASFAFVLALRKPFGVVI